MKIPGWLGPIIGPILAVGVYLSLCAQETLEFSGLMTLGIAAVGLFAGVTMWLGDVFNLK